jgi:3-hydroxyacyl-[acyl-carrier-protein] dehydratase
MLTLTAFPHPAELLPHRAPMLLLDEILDHTPGVSVTTATRILPDNPFFEGHFPGEPILPGVILVEMMFQTCGVFGRLDALYAESESGSMPADFRPKSGRAIKIDTLTFNQVVRPNDRLRVRAVFSHKLLDFSVFKAQVEIEGRGVAAKGTVTVLITL